MYCLYLDSYLNSRLDIAKRHMGLERSVLDLSHSMETKICIEDVNMSSNAALEPLVRKNDLSYQNLPLGSLDNTRWEQLRI